jgi:hypothetical protein
MGRAVSFPKLPKITSLYIEKHKTKYNEIKLEPGAHYHYGAPDGVTV